MTTADKAEIKKKSNDAGFTLVEILVVIAIAALLVAIITTQVGTTRARSRDARREADMKSIQTALALYANIKGYYPPTDRASHPYAATPLTGNDPISVDLKTEGVIAQIPFTDPLNAAPFQYTYETPEANASTYTLRYRLETDTIPGKAAGDWQVSP